MSARSSSLSDVEVGGNDSVVTEEIFETPSSVPTDIAENFEDAVSVEPLEPPIRMPPTTSVAVSTPSTVTTTSVNGTRQPEATLQERRSVGKRARKASYKLLDDADAPSVREGKI